MAKAAVAMIIHDSGRLHEGIDDDGPHKFESALLQLLRHLNCQLRLYRPWSLRLDLFSPRDFPKEGSEVLTGFLHLQKDLRALDGCLNLRASTDDAGIFEQPLYVRLSKTGHLRRIELAECFAEGLALPEHGEPGKASLKTFK